MIVQVVRLFGVSPFRQFREIFSMRGSVQKSCGPECYALRLFDPAKSAVQKRAFLRQSGINAMNVKMNPPLAVPTRAFVGNKLLCTQRLTQPGIPTAKTQVPVGAFRESGQLRILRDAAALSASLRDDAMYPLFGKPIPDRCPKGPCGSKRARVINCVSPMTN